MTEISENVKQLELNEPIFKEIKFFISGQCNEKAVELLKNGGAERMNYFSDYVTHLLCGENCEESDLCDATELYEIPAITEAWIYISAKLKKLVNLKPFLYNPNKLFANHVFCFSNIRVDLNVLWGLITYHGGLVNLSLNNRITHLITTDLNTDKSKKALSLGDLIVIVTPDWLIESIRAKNLVQVALFHPKLIVWPKIIKKHDTTSITGFEPDVLDKTVDACAAESTQALLDKLKQRMPWNQPESVAPSQSATPNYQPPKTPNENSQHLFSPTNQPAVASPAFSPQLLQGQQIPRSIVHHTPQNQFVQSNFVQSNQNNPNFNRILEQLQQRPAINQRINQPFVQQPQQKPQPQQQSPQSVAQMLQQTQVLQRNALGQIVKTVPNQQILQQQLVNRQILAGNKVQGGILQGQMGQQILQNQQQRILLGQQNLLIQKQLQNQNLPQIHSQQQILQGQLLQNQQQLIGQQQLGGQLQNQLEQHYQIQGQGQILNQTNQVPQQNQNIVQQTQNLGLAQQQQQQAQNINVSQQQQSLNLVQQQLGQQQLGINQNLGIVQQNQILSQQLNQKQQLQQRDLLSHIPTSIAQQLGQNLGQQTLQQQQQQQTDNLGLAQQQRQNLALNQTNLVAQQLNQVPQSLGLNQTQNHNLGLQQTQSLGINQQQSQNVGLNQQQQGQNMQTQNLGLNQQQQQQGQNLQNQNVGLNQQQQQQSQNLQTQNISLNQQQINVQQTLGLPQQQTQNINLVQQLGQPQNQNLGIVQQQQQNMGLQQQQNQTIGQPQLTQQKQHMFAGQQNINLQQQQNKIIQNQFGQQVIQQGQVQQTQQQFVSSTNQNFPQQQQPQQHFIQNNQLLQQQQGANQQFVQQQQQGGSNNMQQILNHQLQQKQQLQQQPVNVNQQQHLILNQQSQLPKFQTQQVQQQQQPGQAVQQNPPRGQIWQQQINIRHPNQVNIVQQGPRVQWSGNQQQQPVQRQFIQLDAQTHQQLQQMAPEERAIFVQKLQKQRQLILQRQQVQMQQQRGGHILIRSSGPVPPGLNPQQQMQWLTQQANKQGVVLQPNIQQQNVQQTQQQQPQQSATPGPQIQQQQQQHGGAPGLSPIQQGQPFTEQNQQMQLQRQQMRMHQIQLQREQVAKSQAGLQPLQGVVATNRPQIGQPQAVDANNQVIDGNVPQNPLVNAKTKTALANMLNIRLQSGGSAMGPGSENISEPSAAGTLRLMTAQHNANAALNSNTRPQEIMTSLQQRQRVIPPPPTNEIVRPSPGPTPVPQSPQSEAQKLQYSPRSVLPIQHRPGMFYGHNPNLKLPPDLFLLGCIFVVVELERFLDESMPGWQRKIEKHGGEIEKQYCSRVTHVLCETQRHGVVMQALRECKRCVTLYWLSDVMNRKQVLPPWTALHLPTMYLDTVPASKHLISLTGFTGIERERVKHMIKYTGASFTSYFSKHNTLLIATKTEGPKYMHSKKWGIQVVNIQWLTDVMLGNFSALNQTEHIKYQQFANPPNFSFDPILVPNLMHGWKMPINISQESYERVKRSASPVSIPPKMKKLKTEHIIDENDNLQNISQSHRIIFTRCTDLPELKKTIGQLGGSFAKTPQDATHLVLSQLVRTNKLMQCVCLGVKIVSEAWLRESLAANTFLEESAYALDTKDFNSKYKCDFAATLATRNRNRLLEGKFFFITPSVFPNKKSLSELIQFCGGIVERTRRTQSQIEATNINSPYSYIIITHENDLHLVADLLKNKKDKIRIVCNVELIFSAVLRQTFEVEPYVVKVV